MNRSTGLRNPGLLIPLVMLAAICIIIGLAYMAAPEGKGGFTRHFEAQPLQPIAAIEKKETVFAFAGTRDGQLYFTTTSTDKAFVTDSSLTHGSMQPTGFKIHNPKVQGAFDLTIKDSSATLFAGNIPAVFTLREGIIDSFNHTLSLFTRAVLVDSGFYVYRAYDPFNKYTRDQALVKAHPASGIVAIDTSIIPRLHDAGLGNDGLLHYDALNKQLVYVSYYSNKVYLISPQLQLIKEVHTIDTLSAQQQFAGEEKKDVQHSTITNLKPKRIINAQSYVYNGRLYVVSRIKADNESSNGFRENAVIDHYDLKDFSYTGSFYLPNYKGEKLWGLGIAANNLLALYRNYIVRYDLPNKIGKM